MEKENNKIMIYQAGRGIIDVRLSDDTLWLTQKQMAEVFGVNIPAVNKHLTNVFGEKELSKNSVISKMEITASDGKAYSTNVYSLDAIISVGYRVNSKKATQFRIWATNTLKKYLVDGYAVNERRLLENEREKLSEIQNTILMIKEKSKYEELAGHEAELLDIVSEYARSWKIFKNFDQDKLRIAQVHKYVKYELTLEDYTKMIESIRSQISRSKQAGTLFGSEIGDKIKGIIGSINQTFDGNDLYPSIEEKAAHLLYFVVKDHPYSDGNKRIGSMLFLYYLKRNSFLYRENGEKKINDNAIVALALLIATSAPREKDQIIKLIVNLIQ